MPDPATPETHQAAVLHDQALPEGIPFGKYRLIRKIAVGGMAEVYLALSFGEFGFQRQEVVKALLPNLAKNSEFVDMFIQEAILAAEFRHPNLVQVYNLGKVGELYFLAMEFVDGVDLMRLVRRCRQLRRAIPLDFVLNTVCQAADGLAAVHAARSPEGRPLDIVHRDVNPQNLMVSFTGQAKLVDFGVARTALVRAKAEQALMGKGPYMAPEQWAGEAVDKRADIFALGTVLYELTVGRRLFRRTSPEKTKKAILSGDVPRPSDVRAGYPKPLEAAVLKSLALDPEDRFSDAREMRRALEIVQNKMGGVLHPDDVALWLTDIFSGLDRNELWPRLDLTAPGQLSEAQEALRRTLWNLPAFSEQDPPEQQEHIGSRKLYDPENARENGSRIEPKKQKTIVRKKTSPWLAVLFLIVGAAVGALATVGWFVYH
jgi:serine/threonine-protein kinase